MPPYESASTPLTSNRHVDNWGEVLGKPLLSPRSLTAFSITRRC
jgi:hypothetical protein